MMLKALQIFCLGVGALAVACVATWRFWAGDTWWLAAVPWVLAYVALLSAFFLGDTEAWQLRVLRRIFEVLLSTQTRAGVTLVLLLAATTGLAYLAYGARPADTHYYEVRVYDRVELPENYLVGTEVTIHSRTDGLTHRERVGSDGGAIFRQLTVPTTLVYQLEVHRPAEAFVTGGSDTVERLPAHLPIDVASIPASQRQALPLEPPPAEPTARPRPEEYLRRVNERGDTSLQTRNAPFGVPEADIVINRLGYVLGYDLERKMPRWVAYAVGHSAESVPRADFQPDPAIPRSRQAAMDDYRGSGFDRGHMVSPSDLFFMGPVVVEEASYLSTVTPQTPWLNRRLWNKVEQLVRHAVKTRDAPAFVVAGPLFLGSASTGPQTIGAGRIPVPSHFFRIVAMELSSGEIEAFGLLVPNADDGSLDLGDYLLPIAEIEAKAGLKFFAFLPDPLAAELKRAVGPLW